jgi:nucleotide-binding universal stress UspA family protein
VSEEEPEVTIRRIVVAVDASPHSLAALEAAIGLAARFGAELSGLFVEDVNLLRLAELPFVHEVGQFSATRRRLEAGEMERQIQGQTVRVRRIFTGAAERAQVRRSFHAARGMVAAELLAAAEDADVLVLGKSGWSLVRRGRMGSTTRAVLAQGGGQALILQEGTCLGSPVMVVYDGSPVARKALASAARLAEDDDHNLVVLLPAGEEEDTRRLREEVEAFLEDRDLDFSFRLLATGSVGDVSREVGPKQCGTLVLPAPSLLLRDEMLQALLDEIKVPVLLVR